MYIARIALDGRKQSTAQHLAESAEYAWRLGLKFAIPNLCRLAAIFHDMGKFSAAFVNYLKKSHEIKRSNAPNAKIKAVIHSTQGAKYLYELQPEPADVIMALVYEISSMCVANHHGGLMDGITPDGSTPFLDRIGKESSDLYYAEVIQAAEQEYFHSVNLSALLEQCKKELEVFAKHCNKNRLNLAFMIQLLTKSIYSCLIDSDRYNAYCFEFNKKPEQKDYLPPWADYVGRLNKKIASFKADTAINILRRDVSQNCLLASERPKGIYRLNVPTGGGKTLSSLRYALNHAKIHGMEHIIYVIPYLSVLEQTAKEIKEALGHGPEDDFILEHHSNLIAEESEEKAQSYRILTTRWNCPIIITTMVQFLESIYSNKSGDLRKFHNMANAVVVFDEVQALPLKCTYLFNEAVNYLHYCAGSSILLCTATQPPIEKIEVPVQESKPASLVPDMSSSFLRLKRACVVDKTIKGGYTTEDLKKFILQQFDREENCLVIVNTRKDAARLFSALKEHIATKTDKPIELVHLSNAMCPAHRLTIIDAVKKGELKNVLCISTQLVEAGIDISFSCVIRAVAGLDSVVQAAGRCNRNGEDPNGKNVYLVNLAEEDLSRLPDIKRAADVTYRILAEHPDDLLAPGVLKRFYEEYFYKEKMQLSYPIARKEFNGNLYDLLSKNLKGYGAYKNRGGEKPPALRQAFQTAGELFSVMDQRGTGVLVPYGAGKKLAEMYQKSDLQQKKHLLREIGRYSVSLFPYQIRRLNALQALTLLDNEIYLLDKEYYSNQLGVIFEP